MYEQPAQRLTPGISAIPVCVLWGSLGVNDRGWEECAGIPCPPTWSHGARDERRRGECFAVGRPGIDKRTTRTFIDYRLLPTITKIDVRNLTSPTTMEALLQAMDKLELSATSFCSDFVSRSRPQSDQLVVHAAISLVGKPTDAGATDGG